MLPGYVSGFYSYQDCHIDLGRLSRYAHATLVQQAATGIDTKAGCPQTLLHSIWVVVAVMVVIRSQCIGAACRCWQLWLLLAVDS